MNEKDVAEMVRRPRGWRSAGVAAIAVAVIGGTAYAATNDDGDVEPDRASTVGLPVVTGGATGPKPVDGPTAVFYTKSSVSIDGRTYPAGNLSWDVEGAHIGPQGIVYADMRTGVPYLMKRDGSQVALAPDRPRFGDRYGGWVAADAASPLVAWGEVGRTGLDLVAYDTVKGSEIARKRVHCVSDDSVSAYGCTQAYVASEGVVFVLGGGPQTFAWRPADGTWRSLGRGLVRQAYGKVVGTFPGPDTLDLSVLGSGWSRFDRTGPLRRAKNRQGDVEPLLSFDGAWVTNREGTRIQDWRNPDATVTYDPPGAEVLEATYDTDGSMLFVTRSADTVQVWDCTVTAGCEPLTEPSNEQILLISRDR